MAEVFAIATAAHVVDDAHFWEEPIRITHETSKTSTMLRQNGRAIFLDSKRDSALILFSNKDIPFPPERLKLAPQGKYLRVGIDIGWLGYPAIPSASLCFFGGRVSARLEDSDAYLIDGVAINGVSGGPAFHVADKMTGEVWVMGLVSAYVPNRATGETLPGLSVVRNVEHFHKLANEFASLEQAKESETPMAEAPPDTKPDGRESPKGKLTRGRDRA